MLRYPRASQPKGGVKPEIDWDNPLALGLAGVVLPHVGELIQHGGISPRASGHFVGPDVTGFLGIKDGGSQSASLGWRYPGAFGRPPGELTVFSLSRLTTTPGGSRREAGNFQGGSAQGSYNLAPSASNFRLFYIDSTGTNRVATGAAVDTKVHLHVGTVTAGQIAIYTDGVLGGTATPSGLGAALSGSDFEVLGDAGGGFASPSIIFLAGVFHRALSASEVAAFSRNPWQIFRPIVVPVRAPASGSSGTVNYTNANDTSSASGTTTVVGTSSTTNANDTSSASGTTTVTGTVNYTNANDTSAASGTAGATTGTVDYTNANDTSTASGWAGTVSGTVDYTNNDDTSSAQGQVVGVESDRASGGFAWLEYISDREREEYRKKRREVYQNAPKKVTAVVKKVAQKAAIEQREPEPEEIEQAFESEGVAYQPDYGQMAQNAYRLYLQLLINRRKLEQEAEREREQTRQFIAEQTRIALEDQQRRAQLIEEEAVFMTVAALLLD